MSPQWLDMRIQEEQERRQKESKTQELMPRALEELHSQLAECVERYKEAFGSKAADISKLDSKLRITVCDEKDGQWTPRAEVEVSLVLIPPAFKVERGGSDALRIELGLIPGDRLSYRLADQYLNPDDVSRHILDRALFPKLVE